MTTALITGISGQDGSYLAELLLEKGYDVWGSVRRHSHCAAQDSRIRHLIDHIHTEYADVTDPFSIERLVRTCRPDEVYNLASMSHVYVSFRQPLLTQKINGAGTVNVLEAVRKWAPDARFYQASSSEMFGNTCDPDGFQRLSTPMNPVSPYGCAKLYAYHMVRHYREAYGLFATNGILFNHESPRRGENFVTQKVVRRAVEILYGQAGELHLGNIDSQRDWGHSQDYVRAMWMMLQQEKPGDWIIATGQTRTVRDCCRYVFNRLGMDYRDYVVENELYRRPVDLTYLRGDASVSRERLGWSPEYDFDALMDEMVSHWEQRLARD